MWENTWNLAKGWAERLTLSIVGLFPKVNKQTLKELTNAYNTRNADIQAAKEDLTSKDPSKLADVLNIEGIFKTLKPVVYILLFIGGWYLFSKFYYQYKRRK